MKRSPTFPRELCPAVDDPGEPALPQFLRRAELLNLYLRTTPGTPEAVRLAALLRASWSVA